MHKNQAKGNFNQEAATKSLTLDIAKSLKKRFGLDEGHAKWKANLLIKLIETFNFIDEIVEEMKPKEQIPNPDAKLAKLNRMEELFGEVCTKAFAKAFAISEDEASGPVGLLMEQIGGSLDNSLAEELIKKYPVTQDDLKRLGVPAFVDPPRPPSPAEKAVQQAATNGFLAKLDALSDS